MAWSIWDYQAGPVGAIEDLADYCDNVRILAETATGKRGTNPIVEYRHGESPSPRKYTRAANVVLETFLRYTDSAGAVTHTDGGPGHVIENLGHLKRIFGGVQGQLTRLERKVPDQGTVYIDVEALAEAKPSQALHIHTWPLHAPNPFWTGAADTVNSAPTLTNGGTAIAGSLVIRFTGTANTPRLTHDDTGSYIEIDGALPASGVVVDVAAGTCLKISDSSDYANNLRVRDPWWMELDPGANGVTVTESSGTPTVEVDWIEQWR